MAKLVLSLRGSVVFQCFVDQERLALGRDSTNQVVIDDPSVSRLHAAIVAVGNDHILEDLRSANGTFVNGTRVPRRILQHGDVMEFGAYNLRYMNPKTAQEVDLDRTMLIAGLADPASVRPLSGDDAEVPRTRSTRVNFPSGHVHALAGERAGTTIALDRVVTTCGLPGRQLAVLTRRPHGFFITHVSGRRTPRVNGQPIGKVARLLAHGDLIEVADEKLQFALT